jgi:ketosteroid isomerase-like protein
MSNVTISPSSLLERFIEAEVRYFRSQEEEFPAEEYLDPDFVLHEPESMPYGGAWRGRDGFRRFLRVMVDTWSVMGPKDSPELIVHEDIIVVLGVLDARARVTGEAVQTPFCQILRLRENKIADIRMFYWDTQAINLALGHTPEGPSAPADERDDT